MKNENLSNMSIKIAGHLLLWYSVCVVVYCSWAYITIGEYEVRGGKWEVRQTHLPEAPAVSQSLGEVSEVLQPRPQLKPVTHNAFNTNLFGYKENEYLDSPSSQRVYDKGDLEWGCSEDELRELFRVIRRHVSDPKTQAWCAATTYVESRGRAHLIGDKASLGSYGSWQINKKYHPDIIADMGNDWNDVEVNLIGFLSVLQKQKQWREGRDDYHGMASYYNAGGSWETDGKVYADKVMAVMESVQEYFTTPTIYN